MPIKAVIFDADGIITHGERFSKRFSKDYNISMDKINPFFENKFNLCLTGKEDLKEAIIPFLKNWGWNGSVEDLMDYWFHGESEIESRMIVFIQELRASGIKCYLATNNEKHRTNFFLEHLGFDVLFDSIFSSAFIGSKKPENEFYRHIFRSLGDLQKNEVLFWDDDQEKVDGALRFGFKAQLYKGFEDFEMRISKLIFSE